MNIHKKTIDDLRCQISTTDVEQDTGYYPIGLHGNSLDGKTYKLLLKKDAIEFNDSTGVKHIGQLVYDNKYTYEVDKPIPTIELMSSMTKEFNVIHEYAVNGMPKKLDLTSLLKIVVVDHTGYLDEKYYNIDYEKMTVKVSNKLTSYIGIGVYVNRAVFETLKAARANNKFYFDEGILTSMIINDGCGNNKVAIYNIDSENKDDTSLRIQTVYGTGYIKIKNSSAKSDCYRICVGYDGDTPIIKKPTIKNTSEIKVKIIQIAPVIKPAIDNIFLFLKSIFINPHLLFSLL
jgi:hypothetical protein